MKFRSYALLLCAASLLSACMTKIDAPSLLPRPVEATRPDDLPETPVPVAVDPAKTALAARLVAQAKTADAAFDKALPAGQRSGPQGSEAWIMAQSARSAAEIARTPTLDALTELDGAISAATDSGQDPQDLVAARAQIQAIVDRQNQRIEALGG